MDGPVYWGQSTSSRTTSVGVDQGSIKENYKSVSAFRDSDDRGTAVRELRATAT